MVDQEFEDGLFLLLMPNQDSNLCIISFSNSSLPKLPRDIVARFCIVSFRHCYAPTLYRLSPLILERDQLLKFIPGLLEKVRIKKVLE